eukprot:m.233359 g.233359  ORF g.233359 m.233359 type:complete len:643 (+) comp17082_c6_seq9:129-2057(+)
MTGTLREALVALLTEGTAEQLEFVSNYGLRKDENGRRLPDLHKQREMVSEMSLLLAVASTAPNARARAAAFRAAGNSIYLLKDEQELARQAEAILHVGFLDAAVAALDVATKKSTPEGLRREASRLLNNVAAAPQLQEHLRQGNAVLAMVKHLLFFGTPEEEVSVIGMCVGGLSYMCFAEENKEYLLSSGVVEALLPIAESKSDAHKFVRAMLGVAVLVGEEEAYPALGNDGSRASFGVDTISHPALEATADIVRGVTDALEAAIEGRPYPLNSNTFNRPENILKGVYSLAGNEDNKTLLAESGALNLVARILERDRQSEEMLVLAMRTLRRLCFNSKNADVLAHRPGLRALLQTLKTADGMVGSQAEGLLWQINRVSKPAAQDVQARTVTSDQVMVSYCWANQELVLHARSFLQAQGIRTWMDVDEMAGSTLETMSRAVETSSVILVFFSKAYKNSTSCRTEAEYAYQLRKKLIPVRVDGYQPDGWLGAMLGTKLWYDIRDAGQRSGTLDRLLREIVSFLGGEVPASGKLTKKTSQVSFVNNSPPQPVAAPLAEGIQVVSAWKTEDINAWLSSVGCSEFQRRLERLGGAGLAALLVSVQKSGPLEVAEGLNRILRIKSHPEATLKLAFRLYELALQQESLV